MTRSLHGIVLGCVAGLVAGLSLSDIAIVMAQPEFRSPSTENRPEAQAFKFLSERFQSFPVQLNFDLMVGVVAIPSKQVITLNELMERGRGTVGAMYVPTGSARLMLKPGIYSVEIARIENRWFGSIRDERGNETMRVPATIILGPPSARGFVTVEQSICFEINGAIVCI